MKPLFRKEFREKRMLLFLSFGIILMIYTLSKTADVPWFDFELATGGAYIIFVLLGLIFGVSAFSSEAEKENMDFILSLPVSKNRIFWIKYLVGLVYLLLLLGFILAATRIFSIAFYQGEMFTKEPLLDNRPIFIGAFFIAFYLYSVGFLMSSLKVRAMQAVISGLLLALPLYIMIKPLNDILFGYSSFEVRSLFLFRPSTYHILLCTAISVLFAYYFWKRYVTRGIPYLKTVIKTGMLFILVLGGIYAGLNSFYTRQLRKEILKVKAAGRPTSPIEAAPKLIPDKENAAFVYEEAFKLLDGSAEKRKEIERAFRNLDYRNFHQWAPADKERIFRIAGENKSVYPFIKKASQLPHCRFPLDYAAGISMRITHSGQINILRNILLARAITDVEQDNINTAVDDILSGIRMAEHLSTEPHTSSFRFHTETVEDFLQILQNIYANNDLTQFQLAKITESLNIISGRKNKVDVLAGKRALSTMESFRMFIYPQIYDHYILTSKPALIRLFYRPFLNFGYKKYYIICLRLSERQLDLLYEPYYLTKDVFKKLVEVKLRLARHHPLVAWFCPDYSYNNSQIAGFEAVRDLAKVSTALKRYRLARGHYPETLAELKPEFLPVLPVDPFTGRDFLYRKDKKGFTVYSVGQNLKDDGGKEQNKRELMSNDIVWHILK